MPTDAEPNLLSALKALSLEELRAFFLDYYDNLDNPAVQAELEEGLLRFASQSQSGWRPSAPAPAVVERVRSFVARSRLRSAADPVEVDAYLRQGLLASMAGDHATARTILSLLLTPLLDADIDVGQDELISETLSVDLNDCALRFLLAIYLTTPAEERPRAFLDGLELVHDEVYDASKPIKAVEELCPLPDVELFLPRWREILESAPDRLGRHGVWLREAILRTEGVAGLERKALESGKEEDLEAWCKHLRRDGDWSALLVAAQTAASLVKTHYSAGSFLDLAAISAQKLGSNALADYFTAAWQRFPTMQRLLRHLMSGDKSGDALAAKAARALESGVTGHPRLLSLLHLVKGDFASAAKLLETAPGLGWWSSDHAGELLFPAFVAICDGPGCLPALTLLRDQDRQSDMQQFVFELLPEHLRGAAPFRFLDEDLAIPGLDELFDAMGLLDKVTDDERQIALAALKAAAKHRTDAVLKEKDRKSYSKAAVLIACCYLVETGLGQSASAWNWVQQLREENLRFPAFQEELRRALI